MGRAACDAAASADPLAQGNVGAGTGGSVGPKAMTGRMMKGGLGTASRTVGDLVVGALAVVNCYGDVTGPRHGARSLAGVLHEDGSGFANAHELMLHRPAVPKGFSTNTTIAVVATNARLAKAQARRVAMMAHDGFARAIMPVHTTDDGDTVFALATGEVDADLSAVGAAAAEVMARAIVERGAARRDRLRPAVLPGDPGTAHAPGMKILVINSGSSSIKFQLIEIDGRVCARAGDG